ncbi:MAG: tol-pal system protein YbgF [Bdellovibrionales bacterium]|jgi:tol-pal system protein YbgF
MKTSRLILLTCAALLMAVPAFAEEDREEKSATYNETRLSAQEAELRALNGRLEQIEFSLRRFEQALQRLQSDTDARMAKLELTQAATRSTPQPSVQSSAQTPIPVVDANGTLGALKMQGGKVTGGINKPDAPPLPAVPPDYGLTSQEQYERAFNFLRESDYAGAEESFKRFIEKNPKDKLIENAKYWYGETLYVRGRYEEAAVAFADAYQQNTKGIKAPDALLKLGMALGAMNKTQDACVTLSELKSKYPNAAPAVKSRANDERAKLKCPAR